MALSCKTVLERLQAAESSSRPVRLTFFGGDKVVCASIKYRPREVEDVCSHQFRAVGPDGLTFGRFIGSISHITILDP